MLRVPIMQSAIARVTAASFPHVHVQAGGIAINRVYAMESAMNVPHTGHNKR
jgi:hypothetical protein